MFRVAYKNVTNKSKRTPVVARENQWGEKKHTQ